ncbi:LysR family transcriptional regulator [Tsukamurella sp. 8F]|uniref:LysR family transcriptional regulator n=1 Tax=unclassified Tsukamurella TaxID=2633480 RepID=UPI0023BA028B|nr:MULTISPECIES: LysR family transcriptional regulator [unclassified Tsukamurella]MDF0532634.1 LysR family transcriptional regulator [Tsukamurella sp. 8J]MDF0585159.1 LysR family transcriptional regulator [Tsukamurella sp. 8F]
MGTVLDIVPLRSAVAVARCGGVHRAATALHLTQSTVSAHLRRLEQETGSQIVEKAGRGIRFTPHGQRLLAEAQLILDAHDAAVAALTAPAPKELVIATTEHGADQMIPALSQRLAELPGGYTARFRLDRSAHVARAIGSGIADIAVFLAPAGHEDAVGPLPLSWYGAKDHVITDGPLPIVLFDEPCVLRAPARRAADRLDRGATVAAEAADLAGLYSAARSGLGVTLLPEIDAGVDGLRPVEGLPVPEPLALAVSFTDRVPERVRKAVRRGAGSLTSKPSP